MQIITYFSYMVGNNISTCGIFSEPDVSGLEYEPYEKFFEQRKLGEFPKDLNDEVQQDEETNKKEKRESQDKSLFSQITGNRRKESKNKNKMDEKIKDVPENSKFHGIHLND